MRLQSRVALLCQHYVLKWRVVMGQPRGGRRLVNTVLASGSLMVLVYWLALSHGDITSHPTPRELTVSGSAAEAHERSALSRQVSPLAQPQWDTGDDGPPPLWVPVIEDQLLAYGAYWDVRSVQDMRPPFIRVLVTTLDYGEAQRDHFQTYAAQRLSQANLQCRLHYSSSSSSVEKGGTAEARVLSEGGHGGVKRNGAENGGLDGGGRTRLVPATVVSHPVYDGAATFDILCDVRQVLSKRKGENKAKGVVALPQAVSLHCPDCASPPWAMQIRDRAAAVHFLQTRLPPPPPSAQLAVCVRPAYGPLDDVTGLVEFLSFYFSMGADSLTFYSTGGLSPGASKLLDFSRRHLGLNVEVLPWNWHASPGDKSTVHAWNQHAALNACMLRHRYSAAHVTMIDLDEYIIPRPPFASLPALLHKLGGDYPSASGFQLRNAFFFLKLGRDTALPFENTETAAEMAEEEGGEILPPYLRIFAYTKRMPVYPPGNRSKSIVKPDRMLWTNIHGSRAGMGRPCDGFEEVVVPSELALLQHYRAAFPEPGSMMAIDAQLNVIGREVRDGSALRLRRVLRQWPLLGPLLDFVEGLETADDVLV